MKKVIVSAALLGTVLSATAAETPKVIIDGQCATSHIFYAMTFNQVPGFAKSVNASLAVAKGIAEANKDNPDFAKAVQQSEDALREKAERSSKQEFIAALAAFNTAACQAGKHAAIALPTQEEVAKAVEQAKKQAATKTTGTKG